VVAEGTPEDIAAVSASHTGKFLAEILKPRSVTAVPAKPKRKTTARKTVAKQTGRKQEVAAS
jgi:excinuclease ABC subunit A